MLNHPGASNGQVLRYSNDACSASYAGSGQTLVSIRWTGTGNLGAPVCGYWQIRELGLFVGQSLHACTLNPNSAVAAIAPPVLVPGAFSVTWQTGLSRATFANGLLDFLEPA